MHVRPAAVAGSWYPGSRGALTREVDAYLAAVPDVQPFAVQGLIAPHAGIMFSGPVAAYAYKAAAAAGPYDVVALTGPSHFSAFEGVAVFPGRAFETPLGLSEVDEEGVTAVASSPIVNKLAAPHVREHSLEMQLPFLAHLAPRLPIVPLVMGYQTAATASALGDALAAAIAGRNALLVASTDLSHYRDAATAAALDQVVIDCVARFDADGLQAALDRNPEHACGGGPLVAVMRASRSSGARDAIVLDYADSGDVSGDKSAVVGYLAAAFGTFDREGRGDQ